MSKKARIKRLEAWSNLHTSQIGKMLEWQQDMLKMIQVQTGIMKKLDKRISLLEEDGEAEISAK